METTKTNFQELFVNLLSKLSEREQEVLKKRYQLTSDLEKKATLKTIGDNYSITRERVRQIEKEAIRKIVEFAGTSEYSDNFKALEDEYSHFLERKGGLIREDHLLEQYVNESHDLGDLHANAYLFVLEHLFDSAIRVASHEYLNSVWTLKGLDLNHVQDVLTKVEDRLGETTKLHSSNEMIAVAKNQLSDELNSYLSTHLEKHGDLQVEKLLESYLHSASKIESNILDQWGLVSWETIKPKKLGDKVRLVFQQSTKPLHFRDIAEAINGAKFDHKKICAATVHNELIANSGFVLIGRGIYALKDWGYSSGTVSDIIVNVLKESDQPMSKEDIYDKVLGQRQVNKSTIYLTLINKDKFAKTEDGKFGLLN